MKDIFKKDKDKDKPEPVQEDGGQIGALLDPDAKQIGDVPAPTIEPVEPECPEGKVWSLEHDKCVPDIGPISALETRMLTGSSKQEYGRVAGRQRRYIDFAKLIWDDVVARKRRPRTIFLAPDMHAEMVAIEVSDSSPDHPQTLFGARYEMDPTLKKGHWRLEG